MTQKYFLLTTLSLLLLTSTVFAQLGNYTPGEPYGIALTAQKGSTLLARCAPQDFFTAKQALLGTTSRTAWVPKSHGAQTVHETEQHLRYGQVIDGVPVRAATVVLHTEDGSVVRATGKSYADASVNIEPGFSAAMAHERIAHLLKQQARDANQPLAANETIAEPTLVLIDRLYPTYTGSLRIAYEALVGEGTPTERLLYLDAKRGQLVKTISRTPHAQVPGSGVTTYYGTQNFDVDSVATGRFELRDEVRDITIFSEVTGEVVRSTSSHFDGDPADASTTMAADVYYGSIKFYDLMLGEFGWAGIDGQGEPMTSFVADDGRDFVNAYWSGDRATFGGGNCHYEPLTTLDVVGHEYMHGITQRTSDLIYNGESGALNEGYSDIFGKALEYIEAPDQFSWTLGNRFADSRYARAFRSMEDPNIYDKPKVYKGNLWRDGAGVHTNSGPLGHWFYLLVEGGQGTNDLGMTYAVSPMPIEEALAVAFRTTRDYLTESSGYYDAYASSLLVAQAMYGVGSAEVSNIEQAWTAIGVNADSGGGGGAFYDLQALFYSSSDANPCHPDDGIRVDLALRNNGDDIAVGTVLPVTASVNGQTGQVDYIFDETMESGDFLFEELIVPLTLTPGEYSIQVSANLPADTVTNNNSAFQDVVVSDVAVDLAAVSGEWSAFSCGSQNDVMLDIQMRNTGCDQLDGDVAVSLLDADGSILYTESFRAFAMPGWSYYHIFDVDRAVATEVAGMSVDLVGDSNSDNDKADLVRGVVAAIPTGVMLDFEDASSPYGFVHDEFDQGYIGVIDFAGSNVLAFTGGSYWSNLPCLSPEENFGERFTNSPTTCVDLSGEATPVLSFSMMHRHGPGNPDFPELDEFGRSVRVSYEGFGGELESTVIGSQPDGEWVDMEIPLPANYVGPIFLDVFSTSGFRFLYENGDDPGLEDFDYTLFDNLQIRTSVNTEEPAEGLVIAPNPASERLLIQDGIGGNQHLIVVSSLGQVIEQHRFAGTLELATANWPAGHYTLLLQDDLGNSSQHRIVIVH